MNTEHTEQENTIVEETSNVEQEAAFVEPGTLLREKREALGLTQQQVADRLRLRLSIVQNLEANNFESDLVATFIRGYLRSYAKAVGLKESEVLQAYEKSTAAEPQEQTMQSFSKKTKRAKHDSHIMTITWVILVILIGMSSLWWWQNHKESGFEAGEDAEVSAVLSNESSLQESRDDQEFATVSELTEESGEEPVEPISPADETQAAEESAVDGADSAVTEQAPVVVEEAPVVVEEPTVEAPVVEQSDATNLLTLSFTADCWIQVKDATGKTLSTGIKQAGQTLHLRGQKPLQVILGAPESVSMTFASEPVDLSGYTSGKVARLTLP
ncbi:cytoskeleton protein RodZ [Vibrio diazotrophicus]|uniref:cytoskeleton protein RodZ n=1 Tax=Vibrio diazotrophicus TaxID=685 RepID=UPI00142D7516|nr:cytoskeleton protein RodZ [Vibrio diazotrophicus]NIY93503.1 cytoskeleton protein RodZ [Vibrio diazotrophicus]